MWRSRGSRDRRTVVCIACGDSVLREDAREYDKEGDRWNRRDKEFEYLCADCDDEISHQPRDGLESLICSIESDDQSTGEFLDRYVDAVASDAADRTGTDGAGERPDRDRFGRDCSDRSDRDRFDRDR
ncbi:DNA-directed RNA polymerase subunit RPC12/RpoP [Halorubrum trapanicum]|uniref:DNA-directed RNA polymerase subunit RPC12/RpoP n=1 Tax=Halorubrum trapanicum TaxID=29284 RepID=A0A8J7UNA8_9EURY|nr:hypothetical protein [Halorubrum trapanicum]MBP1901666.1 DNA-directed RNA polymerase subunit RPC12/RpoP [Halorubrum trapanicum]